MTFHDWKSGFIETAKEQVSEAVLSNVAPLMVELEAPKVADNAQPEARKTLRQYLDVAVSDTRVQTGQAKLAALRLFHLAINQRQFRVLQSRGPRQKVEPLKNEPQHSVPHQCSFFWSEFTHFNSRELIGA